MNKIFFMIIFSALFFNLNASQTSQENQGIYQEIDKVYCPVDDIVIDADGIFINVGENEPPLRVEALYYDDQGLYISKDNFAPDTRKIRFCSNGHIYLSKYECCLGPKECPYSCKR